MNPSATRSVVALSAAVLLIGALAAVAPRTAGATAPGVDGKLVYELDQVLYTVAPDGTGNRQLTSDGYYANDPAWSPDGTRVAFSYGGGSGGYGIWVINGDGSRARQVTEDPSGVAAGDGEPTWSPDGNKIAFVRQTDPSGGSDDLDLMVMDVDGTGVTNLTASLGEPVKDPEWSPDGSAIAFSNGFEIFVIPAIGGTAVNLTPETSEGEANPTWSPDGTKIAFQVNRLQIDVMSPNGSGRTTLVPDAGDVWEMSWSPDGTRIGFINRAPDMELWTAGADGSSPMSLGIATDTAMDWQPLMTEHDRSVTLKLKKHLKASGKVKASDAFDACLSSVTVEIQRRKGSKWKTVKTTQTRANGSYRAKLRDRRGKYRAVAPSLAVDIHTCGKAVSPSRKHKH